MSEILAKAERKERHLPSASVFELQNDIMRPD